MKFETNNTNIFNHIKYFYITELSSTKFEIDKKNSSVN